MAVLGKTGIDEEWRPFIAMVAVDFAFAVSSVLLKKVMDVGMNRLVVITYRQSISALFLAPLAYFVERNKRPKLTFRIAFSLFMSAIVGASLSQYCILVGIQYTSPTFSCAFINLVPVLTFIMALPFRMEQLNMKNRSGRAKLIGSLICTGGVVVLILYKGAPLFHFSHSQTPPLMDNPTKSKMNRRWVLGSMALLVGDILWSSWFVLQSHIAKTYPCQYSSTAVMAFFSALQSATIATVSTGWNISPWILNGTVEIGTVLFTGMVGSGLCFVGMSWCVKKRGPVFTAAFSPLIQIMVAVIDIPLLHEQLHFGSVLGSIVVIMGLYILLWGKNMEMKNTSPAIAQVEADRPLEENPNLQV